MTDRDARITELEIALTHHQAVADDLSEIVREHAGRIDRLEARLAQFAQRLAAVEAALPGGEPDPDAPPPHW